MTNIEFILELGKSCIDIAVYRSMGDRCRERQCQEEARRLTFQEGLTRWYERKYNLPNFLCDDFLYSDYRDIFEDGFRASETIKGQFEQWMIARRALPYLKPWMPYSELVNLDQDVKIALQKYESYRVDRMSCSEGVEFNTSGHYRDVLDLLSHSVTNTPQEDLGTCWVFMAEDHTIQIDLLIDRLNKFEPE